MAFAGAISTGSGEGKASALSSLGELLRVEFARPVILSPVFMVMGIWAYFALPREPDLRMVVGVAVLVFAGLWMAKRGALRGVLPIIALLAGFTFATVRTAVVATPVLRNAERNVSVEGYVAGIERRGRGGVVILAVTEVPALKAEERPRRLRINLRKSEQLLRVGDLIRLVADLRPLPRPVMPGGFDFGRQLFFQSIGGVGTARGEVSVIDDAVPARFWVRRAFHDLRVAIGARIRSEIDGPNAAFADAIISGERAQIPKDMNQSLISSGLSHILSISGLHMSLVAGGVFWLVRALLALSPALALGHPIKKYAAVAALLIGLFYMLLADGGPATERSYIMIAVVFFAVLVGRPALSLHNLAIAALIILVLEPEQAVSASFQMSFLAVMGLGAFFEWWQRPREREYKLLKRSRFERLLRDGVALAAGSILTSLIAGALTTIAAGHHFGRVAPYGVLANSIALPVVSLVVMPSALIATLLMPLGLEAPPLKLLDLGLSIVMFVSDWASSLPGAVGQTRQFGAEAAVLMALGAAIVCLFITRLRWLGLVPVLVGVFLAVLETQPDVLIEEQARNVAVRNEAGLLVPLSGKLSKFAVERWLLAGGDGAKLAEAAQRQGWFCASNICEFDRSGKKIVFLQRAAEVLKPCPSADVLIAEYPLRRSCKGRLVTIDRFDVWRNGAQAIRFSALKIATTRGEQGLRPWAFDPRPRNQLFRR